MKRLIFLSFILILSKLAAAHDVPVIIWGSNIQYKPAIALKSYNGYELIDILRKHSTTDTITFVIAEEQLSVEDLSQCKAPNGITCFKEIQKIESKLYFPSVEDPVSLIEQIAGLDMVEVNLLSNGSSSIPLSYQNAKYIFVNFDDDDCIDETKSVKLTRHDQMITTFYKEFLSQNDQPIVVIFTGKQTTHRRRVREAFSEFTSELAYYGAVNSINSTNGSSTIEPAIGFAWKAERFLLYYISLGIDIQQNVSLNGTYTTFAPSWEVTNVTDASPIQLVNVTNPKTNETYETAVYSDTEIIVLISVNYNNSLQFSITREYDYWQADEFTWNNVSLLSSRSISTAEGFSYQCNAIRITGQNESIDITWEGLQLQPNFNYLEENVTSFSYATVCVDYVTPVILSGLFVTFLLLLVLFIGLSCMFSIKSVDRFENPKGKTITVIVEE